MAAMAAKFKVGDKVTVHGEQGTVTEVSKKGDGTFHYSVQMDAVEEDDEEETLGCVEEGELLPNKDVKPKTK